jgi:hypothetical protein
MRQGQPRLLGTAAAPIPPVLPDASTAPQIRPAEKKYLTQKEIGPFLRERGYPFGNSTIDKLCSPAIGEGPPVAAWLNKRPLRTPEACIAWAESRLSKQTGDRAA